jgi:hypothetical protein
MGRSVCESVVSHASLDRLDRGGGFAIFGFEEINGGGFVILGLKETMILFQYGMQFHFYSVYAIIFHCPVFFSW